MSGPWDNYAPTPQNDAPWAKYTEPPSSSATPISAPGGSGDAGMLDQFLHQLGLTARAGVNGALSLPLFAADAVASAAKGVAPGVYGKQPLPSEGLNTDLTRLGLPEPQNTAERIAGGIASMMAGAAVPMPQLGAQPLYKAPAVPLTVRDATIKSAQQAGFKAPPSEVGTSATGRALESVTSPSTLKGVMREKNQNLTDAMMRQAAGLSKDAPLTADTLNSAIADTYNQGYAPIKQLGNIPASPAFHKDLDSILQQYRGMANSFPQAAPADVAQLVSQYRVPSFDSGDALGAIRQLRSGAGDAFSGGNANMGHAQRGVANAIENAIEQHLSTQVASGGNTLQGVQAGDKLQMAAPELLDAYRAARTQIAKQSAVRDALIPGAGSVDALKLAAKLRGGAPLTDELKTVADFADIAPQLMNYPKAPTQLFTPLEGAIMAGSGISGAMSGNLHGVLGATVPAARLGARKLLASNLGQQLFAAPAVLQGVQNPSPLWNVAPAAFNTLGTGLFGQQ